MKLGFFLVGDKGLRVLRFMRDKFDIQFVISYNDKNTKDDAFEAMESLCETYNVKFYNGKTLPSEEYDNIDKVFVIGWQFLLHEHLDKTIVIHDSYLPEYKGWAPTVNYLINGNPYLAATAFQPTDRMDTGDILHQLKKPIIYPMKIKDALQIVSELYIKIIMEICTNDFKPKLMVGNESFCVWRDEEDFNIDWSQPANQIKRFIDAVGYPYAGARMNLNGETLTVSNSEVVKLNIIDPSTHIGKNFQIEDGNPIVVCGSYALKLTSVKDALGHPMNFTKLKIRL